MMEPGELRAILKEFSDTLKTYHVPKNRVPQPKAYNEEIYDDPADFFFHYERYAKSLYGLDKMSWLVALPEFLSGESRAIVLSFGTSQYLRYGEVKDRLIQEIRSSRGLGNDRLANFLKLTRNTGETLTCFAIRLEAKAYDLPDCSDEFRGELVKLQFLERLSSGILGLLEIQVGYKDDVEFPEIVRLARICEAEIAHCPRIQTEIANNERDPVLNVGQAGLGHTPVMGTVNVCTPRVRSGRNNRRRRCYVCRARGHIARNCRRKVRSGSNMVSVHAKPPSDPVARAQNPSIPIRFGQHAAIFSAFLPRTTSEDWENEGCSETSDSSCPGEPNLMRLRTVTPPLVEVAVEERVQPADLKVEDCGAEPEQVACGTIGSQPSRPLRGARQSFRLLASEPQTRLNLSDRERVGHVKIPIEEVKVDAPEPWPSPAIHSDQKLTYSTCAVSSSANIEPTNRTRGSSENTNEWDPSIWGYGYKSTLFAARSNTNGLPLVGSGNVGGEVAGGCTLRV